MAIQAGKHADLEVVAKKGQGGGWDCPGLERIGRTQI